MDAYAGRRYGLLNKVTSDVIRLVAETKGLLLDPVYTGKAFAGLVDLVHRGYFRPGANIVFIHSGGAPALFAYRQILAEHLSIREGTVY